MDEAKHYVLVIKANFHHLLARPVTSLPLRGNECILMGDGWLVQH